MNNRDRAVPVFNIGNQQAGAIYMSGGDQFIEHGEGTLSIAAGALSEVRAAVVAAAPALTGEERHRAEASLSHVDSELNGREPSKARIATWLADVAGILKRAGALATSAEALRRLAEWLGPAGLTLLHVLL